MGLVEPSSNLRRTLREATAHAHDQLDSTMRAVAGWSSQADYARFLSLQHAARTPVEAWLAANAPRDLAPPEQTPLIAADLRALGCPLPQEGLRFSVPPTIAASSPRAASLGVAWVLAGSSLGNRAILAEIRRTAKTKGWADWPAAFLSNAAMLEFWKRLRTQLESGAEMEVVELASQAATLVFDHFLAHAQSSQGSNSTSVSTGELEVETAKGGPP